MKRKIRKTLQILAKHAGQYGIPVDVLEPKGQPGILVIGAKVVMKNSQIARYLGFNAEEEKFEKKVSDFCYSIQDINKIITEDGKQMVETNWEIWQDIIQLFHIWQTFNHDYRNFLLTCQPQFGLPVSMDTGRKFHGEK